MTAQCKQEHPTVGKKKTLVQYSIVQRAADWMRSLAVAAHSGHDPAAMHTTHNNYNSFVSKAISHCILMQILSLYDILSTIC